LTVTRPSLLTCFAAPLNFEATAGHRYPGVLLVSPLCHRQDLSVKRFSTIVVLRMQVILGNSPGIAGGWVNLLWRGGNVNTTNCAFSHKSACPAGRLLFVRTHRGLWVPRKTHIPKLFQRDATRALVCSSTSISSGQGRAKPSVAHLRVASIPILEPKSCKRAA